LRRHLRLLFAVAALTSFFAIAASASAAYSVVGVFANDGPGPGGSGFENVQLTNPGQIAVNDATGRFYVANTDVEHITAIEQTPSGGESAPFGNGVAAPTGVAVDQSTGDVYVANASGVLKYDEELNPITVGWTPPSATGVLAVDPSTGDLLVADRNANLIRRYESDGTPVGSFAAERPISVAANSAGEIFVVTSTGEVNLDCTATSAVRRFSAAGTPGGTVGSLEAPGAVAVDPDDDSILVASPVNQYNCGSQRPAVSFFSAVGTFIESVELGEPTVGATIPGLAARGDGSTRVYAVSKSPENDERGATSITAIAIPPAGTIDPVDPATITTHGAEFTGTVNPGGVDSKWHFEYRRAGTATWTSTPEEDAGSGEASLPVSAQVAGLQANATYEVRLYVASADGGPTIAPISFRTDPAAPDVATRPATQVEEKEALLRGVVNPNNQTSTYYFEYGETTVYGQSVPSGQNAAAGEGGEPEQVATVVKGLAPSTTYHFRIVATNATGTSYGGDRTFTTAAVAAICPNAAFRVGPSVNLSECRAYELVSPVDKSGNTVKDPAKPRANPGWSSPDGDTVLYSPSAGPALSEAVRGFPFPQISERTPDGWVSRPAVNGPSANAVISAGGTTSMIYQLPSADRKSLMFVSGSPFTLDNPFEGINSGGVDIGRGSTVEWISKPTWSGAFPGPGQRKPGAFEVVGASEDLSTAFFVTLGTLTPEDGASGRAGIVEPSEPNGSFGLYRWHDGRLSNAGVLPDGTLDPRGAQMAGSTAALSETNSAFANNPSDLYGPSHSVSADGKSWLFVSPDPAAESGRPTELYLGREGQPSVLLSTAVGQSAPIAGSAGVFRVGARIGLPQGEAGHTLPGTYAMRSKDGHCVLFTTTDVLAAGAPTGPSEKTYRYDLAAQTLTYLPGLTFTPKGNSPGSAFGPVLNMSDDGSRILYRNPETGILGLWREGASPIVLSATSAEGNASQIESRFSTDGSTLVLTSEVPLREEAEHPVGTIQIYRYTEADDELNCISCPHAGLNPRGSAIISDIGLNGGSSSEYPLEQTRGISADGKRIFFQTNSPLVAADHNEVQDVYEWTPTRLRLISSGRAGSNGSYLIDNDADGDNVFFVTADGLVPQDTDGLYDMYDARVGGGFPPPPLVATPCDGEACQGPASGAPSPTRVQSTTLRPRSTDRHGPTKPSPLTLRRSHASAAGVTLSVATGGPGKLKAQGSGLRSAGRVAKRAGTYTLKLGLNDGARRTLQEKGRLKVRVRVRFEPHEGKAATKTVKLTIKTNRKGN
jgi:hypothetical protein